MTAHAPRSRVRTERLAERVAEVDAARFVGREDVLAPIERLLSSHEPGQIVLFHGPAGVGKSALLREIARRARSFGRAVYPIDGRLLPPSAEALLAACADSSDDDRPVLLIDSFEQISALAPVLRDQVLPTLPSSAIVVVAGRQRPAALWFRDGWEHIVRDVALRPLDDDEAAQLLGRHDLDDVSASRARAWAKGSPLALQVAAMAASGSAVPGSRELTERFAARVIGDDLDGVDAEVVSVAAIARSVDEQLIAAALPHRPTRAAYTELRMLSVAEPYGSRLALHDLVHDALRDDLRRRDLESYRDLVCRIADHLHDRMLGGELGLLDELTALVEDPFIRAAYSRGRGTSFRAGQPEPGDAEQLAELLGATGTQWWAGAERFFREAPTTVTVVRRSGGALTGFGIAVTPDNAPRWADNDTILGPLLAIARRDVPEGNAAIWRDCINLLPPTDRPDSSEVTALLNYPAALMPEFARTRAIYGAIPVDDTMLWGLRTAVGATRLPDLVDGERAMGTYVIDNGPGLLVGKVRNVVYAGQGRTPEPAGSAAPSPATDDGVLRGALQSFHDPVALAANPLADGTDVAGRAESVRHRVRAAVTKVFGRSEAEQELRRLFERAYLDPDGGHRRAMAEAHLSRSTYFRRIREATDRVADAL